MDIKEIALKVAGEIYDVNFDEHKPSGKRLISFAEALISAHKAELLKEVGDPFAYYDPDLGCGSAGISFDPLSDGIYLYTSNQVAAAILKAEQRIAELIGELEHTREQKNLLWFEFSIATQKLAAAQEEIANETAEAIAKFVAFQRNDIPATGIEFAEVIRNGAWKEFKK